MNWTEPYLDYFTQDIIISASKSIRTANGMRGVVAIKFNLYEMSKLISNARVGEEGLVMLLSSSGTILANRDNHLIGVSLFQDQLDKMLNVTNEKFVPYMISNKNYYIHSDIIEQNGMIIVTAISEDEIRDNLYNSMFPVLVAGVLCLFLFSIVAYISALKGMRPLKKLVTLMGQVESGNYNVYAKETAYLEVARLSKGFNNMIQAIKRRDCELNHTNNEIKRTEEKLRVKFNELKASEEKIKHLVAFDSLTGLLNRRSLVEVLDQALINNMHTIKAIVFIDLDNFKTVNDTLGHSFGDKLIIEVANKLNSISALKKNVARISGDEFVVVIDDLDSENEAKAFAKEIKELFDEPIVIHNKLLNISSSIGVALYPDHALTSEELLKVADMVMYRAKDSGKNGYRIFDAKIKQEVDEKVEIEEGIDQCLRNNEFELYLQPLFNTKEGRITNIEALLRSNSSALSKFNILQIVQTAEMTGRIVEIDKWVMKEACTVVQKINKLLQNPISISINISPIHIMQQDFVNNVREILEETNVLPGWIELEITETSLMESFDINIEKLYELKKLGISLHLDDFGTGYSSLNYLNSLPIDVVKIDKSFIDMMLESEKDCKIVETIITLSHNIGLQVVAEGVEYKEQFEKLKDYKCELIQGYYMSKPMNYEKMIEMLIQMNEKSFV